MADIFVNVVFTEENEDVFDKKDKQVEALTDSFSKLLKAEKEALKELQKSSEDANKALKKGIDFAAEMERKLLSVKSANEAVGNAIALKNEKQEAGFIASIKRYVAEALVVDQLIEAEKNLTKSLDENKKKQEELEEASSKRATEASEELEAISNLLAEEKRLLSSLGEEFEESQKELNTSLESNRDKYKELSGSATSSSEETARQIEIVTAKIKIEEEAIKQLALNFEQSSEKIKKAINEQTKTYEEVSKAETKRAKESKEQSAQISLQIAREQQALRKLKQELKGLGVESGQSSKKRKKETEEASKSGSKLFGILKKGALAAVAAIAAAGTALVALAFNNDAVASRLEKAQERSKKTLEELGTALAPIAFSVIKVIETVQDGIDKISKDSISNFAISFGATIQALAVGFSALGQNISTVLKVAVSQVKTAAIQFKLLRQQAAAVFTGKETEKAKQLRKELELQRKETENLRLGYRNIGEEFTKTREVAIKELTEMVNKGFFKTKRATKEQIDALKALSKEFEKLNKNARKQLDQLNLDGLGEVEKIVKTREVALASLDKQRTRAVELANKLGKPVGAVISLFDQLGDAVNESFSAELRSINESLAQTFNDTENSFENDPIKKLEFERNQVLASLRDQKDLALEVADELGVPLSLIEDKYKELGIVVNETFDNEIDEVVIKNSKKAIAAKIKELEALTSVQLKEVGLLEKNKDSILTLEQEKEAARLKILLRAAVARLNIIKSSGLADQIEVRDIEATIKLLNQQLSNIGKVDLSNVGKLKESIIKALGVTPEEFAELEASFNNALASISEGVKANIDRQIGEQTRLIDSLKEQTEETKSELEKQLKLREEGKANDVKRLEEKLKEEEAQIKAANQRREKLQLKAAKQQLAIDALKQGSALAVAAAEIFASTSGIPVVGIALAVAAVAGLFASFAKFKAQASEISGDLPQLAEGMDFKKSRGKGMQIEGRPHSDGGNLAIVGEGRYKEAYEISRGEVLVGEIPSSIHNQLLNEFNQGKYNDVPVRDLVIDYQRGQRALSSRVTRISSGTSSLEKAKKESEKKAIGEAYKSAAMDAANEIVKGNRATMKSQPQIISLGDGTAIIIEKNEKGDVIRTQKMTYN